MIGCGPRAIDRRAAWLIMISPDHADDSRSAAPAPRRARRRSSRVRREVTRDASLAYWPRCSCCSLAARLPPLLPPLLPRLLLAALLPPLLRPILGRDKHAVV
eukprot:COSAG06_NODE_44768_length_360_cov_1.785441_1_plen_102_part_10